MNESSNIKKKPFSQVDLNVIRRQPSTIDYHNLVNLIKSASSTDIDHLNIIDSKSLSNLTAKSLNQYKSKRKLKSSRRFNDDTDVSTTSEEDETDYNELKENFELNTTTSSSDKSVISIIDEEEENHPVQATKTSSTISLSSIETLRVDEEDDFETEDITLLVLQDNYIDSSHLDSIFKNKYNLIEIEYKFKKLTNNLFIKIIHITETYNRFINYFYTQTKNQDSLYLNSINLILLIRSVMNIKDKNNNDSNYFIFILKTLIRIILVDEKMFDNKKLFDIDFKNLILDNENSSFISLIQKFYLVSKLSNEIYNNTTTTSNDKLSNLNEIPSTSSNVIEKLNEISNLLFEKSSNDTLLDKLNKANCLDDLNEETKLDLIQRLLDIIMSNINSSYRMKLDSIENEIKQIKASLFQSKNEKGKFELKNNIYDLKNIYSKQNINMETANLALHLENSIMTYEMAMKKTRESLELFMRQNYFSKVYLNDCDCVLKFWYFDSLNECLMIEKQSFFLNDSLLQQEDIYSIGSEWYLINDIDQLNYLLNVFNIQLMDSKLTNTILGIIKNIENSRSQYVKTDLNNNIASIKTIKFTELYHLDDYDFSEDDDEIIDYNQKSDVPVTLSDYVSYYHYLCEFKNRLLSANFISHKTNFNTEDDSIEGFEIEDSLKAFCDIEIKNDALESTLSKRNLLHLMVI
jgi:hypothetical protein